MKISDIPGHLHALMEFFDVKTIDRLVVDLHGVIYVQADQRVLVNAPIGFNASLLLAEVKELTGDIRTYHDVVGIDGRWYGSADAEY